MSILKNLFFRSGPLYENGGKPEQKSSRQIDWTGNFDDQPDPIDKVKADLAASKAEAAQIVNSLDKQAATTRRVLKPRYVPKAVVREESSPLVRSFFKKVKK